ncbi:hypothetical protein CJO81_16610 [Ralstonia solanacearum]|uniref:hypothetical protein n=3 Tax=Ralstonia pseudosolanacearum TaxID=1310165 RepID=UPI000E5762E0|nr:hypothetical protein [Ralstonia pseudosolanacearum]AXW02235.1 hypothetical protein CJO81_16610 [Ralstonia solanacearum]AXW29722.1 hypothetical protein CJO87_16610 [Ralstonia solanacearum]UYR07760.1 hypothetical protein NQS38_05270 [Ralstonia pseudosolanacearum]
MIQELAPAFHDQVISQPTKSVSIYVHMLRKWWRVMDAVEASDDAIPLIASVADLSDLLRQFAVDSGMDRLVFGGFLKLANTTRIALGLRKLHWLPPEERVSHRHLRPQWQTDLIRHKLKHRWFATLERWATADALRAQDAPIVEQNVAPETYAEQLRLLRNYRRFDALVTITGHPRPGMHVLRGDVALMTFYRDGLSVSDMMRGRYPDGDDIRAAFHLCLATTGWNPSVLLSLDVTQPFLEPHPKDPRRYILRGIKARAGGAEQVSEGLFKTRASAGAILQVLVARTAALRDYLRKELQELKAELSQSGNGSDAADRVRKRIIALEQAIRSPWLFASKVRPGIQCLTDANFAMSMEKKKYHSSYLADFIKQVNARQPPDRQLTSFTATDLRDAYAAYVYRTSGGSVLAVMKALNHRRLSSTALYLNNTLLKEEHRKLFSTFSWALWEEVRTRGSVDPTILAKWSRDGQVAAEERERLSSYRTLLRSRVGVGCKDPLHPPKHIAPEFGPNGRSVCPVQRCTLCLENAVILPESLSGLCKRLAELRSLHASMGISAFQESSFPEEIENTEIALLAFDSDAVHQHLRDWEYRIAKGKHRVIEFDGEGSDR